MTWTSHVILLYFTSITAPARWFEISHVFHCVITELLICIYLYLILASLLNYIVWQMSLVPLMFRDWWDDFDRPSRLLDQHFGLGLRHHDLLHPGSLLRTGYIRPWRNITRQDSGSSSITADKDKFQVNGHWYWGPGIVQCGWLTEWTVVLRARHSAVWVTDWMGSGTEGQAKCNMGDWLNGQWYWGPGIVQYGWLTEWAVVLRARHSAIWVTDWMGSGTEGQA